MKKLILGTVGLVTAMVFAGGNVAFSAEATTPSQHHTQAQMTPDTPAKGKASAKRAQAKKAKKAKKSKKARKSTQPVN